MAKPVRLSGMAALTGTDADGSAVRLGHTIEVEVGDREAIVGMRGLGGGGAGEVRDGHPAVRRHWRAIDGELRRTAYRERPAVGDPKPKDRTGRANPPDHGDRVICPECLGTDLECGLCEGGAMVTPFEAEEWTAQRGDGGG